MTPALLYHSGGLGDFVLSLPAIYRVRSLYPCDEWRFWGPTDRLPLLPGFRPAPDALLRSGHTLWGEEPDPEAVAILEGCPVVLAFGGRSPPTWVQRLSGVKSLALASFPPIGGPWVPVHHAQQLDSLGVPRVGGRWLPEWRRRVLPVREPAEIVVHLGSGDPGKNLAEETWLSAVAMLRQHLGAPAVLVSGPAEVEREGGRAVAAAGAASAVCERAADLLAVLSRARLFLGSDSGPGHLAGLLGIPAVSVFGPSNPSLWRPLGPRVEIVRTQAKCAPCSDGSRVECAAPHCLQTLGADLLVAAALKLLGERADHQCEFPQGADHPVSLKADA